MRTAIASALVVAVAASAPRTAGAAAVSVLGNTDAHQCFLSASVGSTAAASLESCTKALDGGALGPKDHAATLVNMGILLNGLARTDDAIEAFEEALALSPELPEAALSRGNSHFLRRDWDRAIEDYERSLRWGIRDPAAAHFNHGMAHGKKGDFEGAARSYRRALEAAPDFGRARAHLDRLHALGLVRRTAAP